MKVVGGAPSPVGWLGDRPGSAWGTSAGVVVGAGTIGLGVEAAAGFGGHRSSLGRRVGCGYGRNGRTLNSGPQKHAEPAERDDYNHKHS